MSTTDVQRIIASLNSIQVGELKIIREKVEQTRGFLQRLELAEQALLLERAVEALDRGRLAEFRKLIARATAELGHRK